MFLKVIPTGELEIVAEEELLSSPCLGKSNTTLYNDINCTFIFKNYIWFCIFVNLVWPLPIFIAKKVSIFYILIIFLILCELINIFKCCPYKCLIIFSNFI